MPVLGGYEEVDGEQVYNYGILRSLNAGIWIQDRNRHIIIYGAPAQNYEHITERDFTKDGECGPMHFHNDIEIGYVVEGVSVQTFYGKEHRFQQGDFWIVDQGCYHSDVYQSKDLCTIYIGIPSGMFDSASLQLMISSGIERYLGMVIVNEKKKRQFLHFTPKSKNTTAPDIMDSLMQEVIERKIGYELITRGLLNRLVYSLCMEYSFSVGGKEKQKIKDMMFNEIDRYMHVNYQAINIQDLIDKFHYNRDYYSRLIKEYKGCTYAEYIRKIRMEKAAELLQATGKPIETIASEVGYQSKSNFYHAFQEEYVMTPVEYRRKHQ